MNKIWCNHWTLLVRWPLHKYKCLWNVGDKSSTLPKGTSYTYTYRLWYSRISILKKKKKNWCGKKELMISIYLFQKPLEINIQYLLQLFIVRFLVSPMISPSKEHCRSSCHPFLPPNLPLDIIGTFNEGQRSSLVATIWHY